MFAMRLLSILAALVAALALARPPLSAAPTEAQAQNRWPAAGSPAALSFIQLGAANVERTAEAEAEAEAVDDANRASGTDVHAESDDEVKPAPAILDTSAVDKVLSHKYDGDASANASSSSDGAGEEEQQPSADGDSDAAWRPLFGRHWPVTAAAHRGVGLQGVMAGQLARGFVYGVTQLPRKQAPSEEAQCRLLGNAFSYIMQLLLGALCMASLIIKWYLEVPQRRFLIFMLDCSKQIAAALWFHFMNMGFAMYLDAAIEGNMADECAWYFINFSLDTTVGLFLNFLFLRMTEKWLRYESGKYWKEPEKVGDEPELEFEEWLKQIMAFTLVVTMSKSVIVTMMLLVPGLWAALGAAGTTWISSVDTRLFFVMVVVPIVMDTAFFWITDEFIRYASEEYEDDDAQKPGGKQLAAEQALAKAGAEQLQPAVAG